MVHFRVLFFGFTYLDYNVLILDNLPFLKNLSNFFEVFRQDVFHVLRGSGAYYRPVFTLSLMADAAWGGASPIAYHLSNLLIHTVAAGLFFRLLVALGAPSGGALLAALVFSIHPVQTQAVAWIPARNDSMLGAFVFASLLGLRRFQTSGAWGGLAAHLAFAALALFTKETAVVLVPIGILMVLLLRDESAPRPAGAAVAWLAGWAALGTVWLLMRTAALQNPLHIPFGEMLHSLWLNLPALLQFLGKILVPLRLSVLPLLQDTPSWPGWTAVALLAAALWRTPNPNWRRLAFGAAVFILFLIPSFILHSTILADIMMEQRVYVPLAGFLFLALELEPLRGFAAQSARARGLAAAVLSVLGFLSFGHAAHFRDRLPFWKNAVLTSPHLPIAHRNLGAMHFLDGRYPEAAAEFAKSLELNPAEPMANNNLGLIYMNAGRFQEAEAHYRRELVINPAYDNAHYNLGLLYHRQNRVPDAVRAWERALELNPDHREALYNLAVLHYLAKDRKGAAPLAARLKALSYPLPPELANLPAP